MSELIDRYRAVHRTGQDCRVTSARNLLELHGRRYSYSMVQGLASCFFFTYRKKFSPLDMLTFPGGDMCKHFWPISGQRMEVLENLAYLFNAVLVSKEGQQADAAHEEMLAFLRAEVPVMVQVSRHSMATFLNQEYGYPDFLRGLSFGGHYVMVVAADETRKIATLFDTDHQNLVDIPFDALIAARSAGDGEAHCFMQSRNRWAVFVPGTSVQSSDHMVAGALRRVIHNFRSAEAEGDGTGGLSGLAALCREIPQWRDLTADNPDCLRATVFMLRMHSDLMSGGSIGRRSFGIFVRQSAEILKSPGLAAAAGLYADSVGLWQTLMLLLEQRVLHPDCPESLDTQPVRDVLFRLAEVENEAFFQLESSMT